MFIPVNSGNEPRNFVLASLEPENDERLHSELTKVTFQQGEILAQEGAEIANAYFPTSGLLSWTKGTSGGDRVEVGITGGEGMAGWPLFCGKRTAPFQIEVELAGEGYKLAADAFTEILARSESLRRRMFDFTYLKMAQLTQSALCNRYHSVEERLCRWLLAAQDRSGTGDLQLTRDILSQMIGSRRPAASLVTGALQTAGLIRAERGRIMILNRQEVEEVACECYRVMKKEYERYLAG